MNPPRGSGPAAPAGISTPDVEGLAVRSRRPHEPAAIILFVHGAMDRAASFGRVMRRMDDVHTIAHDRRGYAGSIGAPRREAHAAEEPNTLADHVDDLRAVLEWATAETPGVPVVVVGHSLGGLVALLAAAGDRAGALESIDAVCAFEAPLPWTDPGRRTSGTQAIEVGRDRGPGAAAELFYRSMVGDSAWERLAARERALRVAEGPALLAELLDARQPRATVPLVHPGVELHLAVAENGPEHLHRATARLAEATGVPVHTIAGAGHGAHLSHPGEFSQWVRRALGAFPDRTQGRTR